MDFKCSGDNLEQIPEEVIQQAGITFPEAHTDRNSMATLAAALRKQRGDVLVRVPFCVTVEAEALGAHIKLGNAVNGPRVEEYVFSSIEEAAEKPKLDVSRGRIKEVLEAVEILAEAGERVALSVEGPFTIISSLMDPMNFYKGLRKNPEAARELFAVLEEGLIAYALEGIRRGATIISYGDPVGGMDIVGPKVYKEFSGPSSLRIIKGIQAAGKGVIIHLCGKTSTALEKLELVSSYPIEVEGAETYGDAIGWLLDGINKPTVLGHKCIKWSSRKLGQPVLWGIK